MPLIRSEDFVARQDSNVRSAIQREMEADHQERLERANSAGRREGFDAGLNEARASLAEAIASLAVVDPEVEEELERMVLTLVAACLQKIAGDDVHPEATRNIVRNVVRSSIADVGSVVFVSREDMPFLRDVIEGPGAPQIEMDSALSAGEILVVGPLGRRRLGKRDQIAALLRQLAATGAGV